MFFGMKRKSFVLAGIFVLSLIMLSSFSVEAKEDGDTKVTDVNDVAQSELEVEDNTKLKSSISKDENKKNVKSAQTKAQNSETTKNTVVNNQAVNAVQKDTTVNDNSAKKQEPQNANNSEGYYYKPTSYLVSDQRTALLTITTNDTTNIQRAYFRVWTGDGSDMHGFEAYLQSDGRWMSFVPVSLYGKSGNYNCLATVVFNDGHEENIGFVYFEVEKPIVGSVSMQNINESEGTFDIVVSNVYCPAGVSYIEVVAFTKQDFSDAHVYYAYKKSNGTFVANGNVIFHNYNYGDFGIAATVHGNNGVTGSKGCGGKIKKPQTKFSVYTNDNKYYFLIAENTPYNSVCVGTSFYVWHDGLSDMRLYQGFKDGNRWLSILSVLDYGKSGNYMLAAKGQIFWGPEFDVGAACFTIYPSYVKSVSFFNSDSKEGTFCVGFDGICGLGGYRNVRAVIFTQSDFSDAYISGCVNCGNGVYMFSVDVASYQFRYGVYGIAPLITNAFGVDEFATVKFYNFKRPNTSYQMKPNYRQTVVKLGNSNLPYTKHIARMEYYVWSNSDASDLHCYSTAKKTSDGAFEYEMQMSDFLKTGVFYVRPQIVRDNQTKEWLDLQSFNITKEYYQTEVIEVNQTARVFTSINAALKRAESIGYDLLHKIEIIINPGTYVEKIKLINKHGISLIGTDRDSVIIEEVTTYPDCIVNCSGDITFKNITIRTTGGTTYAVHIDSQDNKTYGGYTLFENCSISGGDRAIGYGASQNSKLHVKNCELYGYTHDIYAHNCPYTKTTNQWLVLESNLFKVNANNVAIRFDDASTGYGTTDSFLYVKANNNRYEGVEGTVLAGAYPERESYPTVDFRNRVWCYPIILDGESAGNSNIPALDA